MQSYSYEYICKHVKIKKRLLFNKNNKKFIIFYYKDGSSLASLAAGFDFQLKSIPGTDTHGRRMFVRSFIEKNLRNAVCECRKSRCG